MKNWKYYLFTLLYVVPIGLLIGDAFFGISDWTFPMRYLAACVISITFGLYGVYAEKVKVLEARLERLEGANQPTQPFTHSEKQVQEAQ